MEYLFKIAVRNGSSPAFSQLFLRRISQNAAGPTAQKPGVPHINRVLAAKLDDNDVAFKGSEEVLHEAYAEGGVKDAGIDQGPEKNKPVRPKEAKVLEMNVSKPRKLHTFAKNTRQYSTDAPQSTADALKEKMKPVYKMDKKTGAGGFNPDHDVDYDAKKDYFGREMKPDIKWPLGEVVGLEGVESVDGAKPEDAKPDPKGLMGKESPYRSDKHDRTMSEISPSI